MLTLEEALGSLDLIADLPALDNYILILQECRQKASLAHVKHIHKHICSKGLEAQTVLGNHLVPTFVDCGSVTTAQQVFNRLDHCSEHAWTSLMQGYTEGGEFLHAIDLYQKMEKDSVCPSRYTFMALLKACAKMKLVERGQEIHAEIAAKGLDNDTCLGNTLVDMYAKAGSLSEAREVLDKMPLRDAVSWTALIAGYAQHGLSEEALNCLEQMQSESLFPNASTYVCTLKACAGIEAIDRGQEIHTGIAEEGLEKDLFVGCSLVHMYAKCGSIAEAEDAFNTLPVRDVVSWNALIAGYAEHGLEEEALSCFRRMQREGIPPNAAVFVCGLKVCAQIGALEKGQEIHAELIKEGYDSDHTVEKTVIDMYAKCGLLAEALDVFNELPVRDSLSWTSIIAGYAEHDYAEEALSCLERMQLEGVSADALTLIWSLKACGSIEALGRGQQIHKDIAKEGFEEDRFLGGCLVDMYVKCGLLAEAREVFDELPVRDVVSWTTLIAGYAEFGLGEEALTCFQEMQRDGVSADAVSYISSLKACATLGATDRAREIHTEIANKGLEIDPLIGSSLMDMYAKCGSLAEARVLFEELPVRAEFTWNALISGYTTHGFFNEALGCFQQMQLEGVFPSAVSFVHGLKVCSSTRAMHRGQEIHSIIVEQEMEREPLVGCGLVDMYAKCASLTEAREVFDELPIRKTFAWNMLIAGYVEHGFDKDALNCFQQMQVEGVSPNTHTFVCTLKACGSIGAIDRGREIHADIAKTNYERDIYVCNILVDMYTKCGSLADAQEVFYRLPVRDVVTWTALIAGYAEHGIPKKALDCLEQMENEGIPFDAITLDCGLKACSSVGAMYKGRKIYNEIVKKGFERDPFIVSTLVSMYARFGSLAEARVVFDEIPYPDVISWNTLLAGYAEHGLCEEAYACFSQMQLDGLFLCAGSWNSIILAYAEQGESERAFELYTQMQEQGLSPDTLIFLSISEGCGYDGALETGKRIHAQICGIDPEADDVIMATALIDMYSKCGSMIDAQKVFDAMPSRDLIAWNALLIGYCRHGEIERVLHSFESMIREGTQPDAVTFICILTACSHVGLVCEGENYIQDMSNEYGIIPSIKHHNCIVDLLGRAGQLDEAMVMAEIMPFQHDFVVWSTVMGACQKWNNPKLGRQAFECAVSVEEEHAAAFILMSNIYADTLRDGGED